MRAAANVRPPSFDSGTFSLHETVLLDALATRMHPDEARPVLDRALASAGGPDVPHDAASISGFVRGALHASLCEQLGGDEAKAVVDAAEALLAHLKPDRLIADRPVFRGPFILVSGKKSAFERVLDVRRVTTALDLLHEADQVPHATLVIDAWSTPIEPITLAAMTEDLPPTMDIVVVGALAEDEDAFVQLASRQVTFTDVYEPLGLVRRAARQSATPELLRAAITSRPAANGPTYRTAG